MGDLQSVPAGGGRGTANTPLVLRPMLAAADRMRTSLRLATVSVLLMVPGIVASYAYSAEIGSRLAFSTLERDGADLLVPALVALAATAGGQTPDLEAIRASAGRHPELPLDAALADLPDTAGGTDAQRLALAASLAGLITEIGNVSNLILDPDLDSFYVMDIQVVQLPRVLLATAKAAVPPAVRAVAAGVGGNPVAAQAVLAGELSAAASGLRSDMDTAVTSTAVSGLGLALEPIGEVADATAALATALSQSVARPGPAAADDVAGVVDTARDATAPTVAALQELLTNRIDDLAVDRRVVLGLTTGGFAVAWWFAATVLWRTRHDVRLVVVGVSALAEGDFTELPRPHGRDEFGEIGAALSTARSRLAQQDEQLREAQEVRHAQMRASFLHQRHAEVRLRERAQTIIDESTTVIAEDLRVVNTQVEEVSAAATAIESRMSETDVVTTSVVDDARKAEQVISALEDSLRRVAETAAAVNGIARQTRLLALNATIEAARAGELGLGFTVVADEVKQLANTTARSTDQIAETIAVLEQDTAKVSSTIAAMVIDIGTIGASATELSALATVQDTTVRKLAERVDETLVRVEEMSGLAAQLERRRSDRIAALGDVRLHLQGRADALAVNLVNLSSGGMRCSIEPAVELQPGDLLDAELVGSDGLIRVHAVATYRGEGDDSDEVGMQFLINDTAVSDQIEAYVDSLLAGGSATVPLP